MLDYMFIKKLGIKTDVVDSAKSYISFDSNTCYNIIELYLNKEEEVTCDKCGCKETFIRGTKVTKVKTAFLDVDNVLVNVHRRVYKCSNGHTFLQANPLISAGNGMSVQLELRILNELRNKNNNFTNVAKKFNVSTSYVIDLFDRKVDVKRLQLPQVLCIDEVYAKKLVKYSYCCILYSPQRRKIIDVLDSRHKFDLIDYFSRITIEEKNNVQFVSMDLWDSYREMTKICLPNAKISADPFHVIKNLNQCFQKIRIQTMNKYQHLKYENSNYYWLYKKFWKFLLMDISKLPDTTIRVSKSGCYMNKYQIIDNMLSLSPKLTKAYELKEEYRNFIATSTVERAEDELDELIVKFKDAHIPEYSTFIGILENWHDEIINSFNRINGHKITNGPMERVNLDIKNIFSLSFGSTNFTRVRNKIMFSINENTPILAIKKNISNKMVGKPRGNYNKKGQNK